MIIYEVISEWGDYSTYSVTTIGIFSTKERAEEVIACLEHKRVDPDLDHLEPEQYQYYVYKEWYDGYKSTAVDDFMKYHRLSIIDHEIDVFEHKLIEQYKDYYGVK